MPKVSTRARDYWAFTAIARSFRAVDYGSIVEHGGLTWRKRGGDYVLLSPPRPPISVPSDATPTRVRSLTWTRVPTSIPAKRSGYTFNAPHDWVAGTDGGLQRILRKGSKEGVKP